MFQLTSIVEANSAGVSITLLIAIVLALWSASGGMAALITGIHVAHEREEPKSFVAKRGKALLLTFCAMVFLGVVIFIIAAVPPLLSDAGMGTAGRVVFGIVRWPLLAAVMIAGIGLLYRFALKDGPRGWLGVVTPGAVVAMVGWLIVSGAVRRVHGELLQLQQDLRRAGVDHRAAALAVVELAARADRRRGRRGEARDERHEFVSALRETFRDS